MARMFDVTTGQAAPVAQHDAPVRCVKWVDAQGGILATGSWDKTIKVTTQILRILVKLTGSNSTGTCALQTP